MDADKKRLTRLGAALAAILGSWQIDSWQIGWWNIVYYYSRLKTSAANGYRG